MERDLCPREKVSKARRFFKMIFKELLVDVEAKRITRIDHDVRMMLKEQNMCVNTDYRVGEVLGKGLLKGNMALVNSMKHKAAVRVIRGCTHRKNKQMFVYLGLYVVKSYSEERGTGLFQFLLERVRETA
ncbi:unnamed protein product [Brassica napus]|uniref:(rape) hypothetical protein n=1 Tax=Brassica napus TaxID=3708 RepID=A0A816X5P1_BRANA|nr:unnamed protein product [Brassica napus]